MQKYENAIKLMLDICDYVMLDICDDIRLYDWIDATGDVDILKSETACSLMFTSTTVTGDKIIVSLLRDYRIAVIFAKIDHSPLGFKTKIMRALCPRYVTYYYKNYILIGNDAVETAAEGENPVTSFELTYAKFIYLWGKIYQYVTKKDFADEYKAYANHIDAKP